MHSVLFFCVIIDENFTGGIMLIEAYGEILDWDMSTGCVNFFISYLDFSLLIDGLISRETKFFDLSIV